jgi:hypothetical protein
MERWKLRFVFGIVAAAGLVTPAALATSPLVGYPVAASSRSSSTVLDWNRYAIEALANDPTAAVPGAGQTTPVSALHMAMVQGAVYDAVNVIDGGHEPYIDGLPPASPRASKRAAVATAAHHVLVGLGGGLVPPLPQAVRDRLDTLYAAALAAVPNGQVKTDGIAAGAAAATAMLAARADDGRYVPFSHPIGSAPGEWRPTPPGFVNDPFAWVANVDPFVLNSPSQFRTRGPLALTSRAYAREYNEVKILGTAGSPRTPHQEAVAQFYTENPHELFNRTMRTIAEDEGLTLVEQARLFAMLDLAAADSLINCWNDKAFFSFWRPITAIQEGDNDGNRRTVGDAAWVPLSTTPPYPDHVSGYNCVTAGMMHAARAFFGRDRMNFDVVRVVPGEADMTRHYRRLTDVIEDTMDARVYQGIHFRTADVQGAQLGKRVARFLNQHHLRPTD